MAKRIRDDRYELAITMQRRETLALLWSLGLTPTLISCARAPNPKPQSGTVLIAGATGVIGRDIATKVKEAGYTVRGMTRSVEKARREFGNIYEWVAGDVRDPASLATAAAGVDHVISTINGDERTGISIVQRALEAPAKQIAFKAGTDSSATAIRLTTIRLSSSWSTRAPNRSPTGPCSRAT